MMFSKWWFHDVFLPEVKKRTSSKVSLIADNFGSHDYKIHRLNGYSFHLTAHLSISQ